jgi:phosphoribosylcarboxyaminoimidazole (NCAIR) mutase
VLVVVAVHLRLVITVQQILEALVVLVLHLLLAAHPLPTLVAEVVVDTKARGVRVVLAVVGLEPELIP